MPSVSWRKCGNSRPGQAIGNSRPGRAMKALRFLLVAGIASLLLPSGPGAAQGVLLDARVQMALPLPGEAAQIQITYRILPGSGGLWPA